MSIQPERFYPTWTLGDRIRKARLITGMNQRDFAPRINVKPGSLAAWEADHSQPRDVVAVARRAATILELAGGAWCFPSQRGAHLTPRSVGTICSALLGDEVTLHQLRHTFATNAYRGSHNLRAVQKLLGHTNLATTERYLDADDSELRAAMLAAVA